jgi:hypothetical protein
VLLLRFGTSLLLSSTVLAWTLAAVVCIPALVLEGRLYRRLASSQGHKPSPSLALTQTPDRTILGR